ncbi:MAG: glycine zipper 2TM domain-containing protein [Thiocapsa sp.]|uniref:glycine zipper 2TM domain-containing protein n=1 Tax=Thiocapsa sp. TaxID=2024551 RepID=UPI001BCA8BA9|nr:glycine zipper 2TM domain-containing protein [Thiocapsa sp.]QVL50255.1 MAG: glycine zipper 2TM domain-containing protein [Thiocapsa sp.]
MNNHASRKTICLRKVLNMCVVTVVTSILVIGCVTTGENTSDEAATTMQGAIGGAVLGTLAGALACKGNDRTKCMVIGAAAGAAAGGVFGNVIAQRKKSYASKEEALAGEIAWNQKFTKEVHAVNKTLQTKIDNRRKEITAVQKQKVSLSQRQTSLEKQSKALDQDIAAANQQIVAVDAQLRESRSRQKQYGTNAQLNAELAKLENERNLLNSKISTLNAMNNSLGV